MKNLPISAQRRGAKSQAQSDAADNMAHKLLCVAYSGNAERRFVVRCGDIANGIEQARREAGLTHSNVFVESDTGVELYDGTV